MIKFIIVAFLLIVNQFAFAQSSFTTLQEVLALAEKNSYSSQVSAQQIRLANLTTKSSYFSSINPRIPIAASVTDNAIQQVSFLPAEIVGGAPGTFKSLTLGQRYISLLNFSPQFEILNFGNIAKIKSAKTNEQLINHSSKLTKKNLFDQVNACYHNIVSFQSQIEILLLHQQKSDSLLKIVTTKFNQGLIRKQDVNEAEINTINIKDKVEQAKLSLEQQYLILKLLCDTDENIEIKPQLSTIGLNEPITSTGNLLATNAQYQFEFAKAEYNAAKWNNMPVLSFVTSFNYQNNSNYGLLDSKNPWIYSNFWSLRFSWDFPTNVTKLTVLKSNLINLNIVEINLKHAILEAKIQNEKLEKDLEKSVLQYKNNQQIYQLKLDNFKKSNNQYNANILSLDKLLISHSDLLLSEMNVSLSLSSVLYNKAKIEINNQDLK